MSSLTFSLAILLLAVSPAFAVNYIVGDSQGWNTGINYDSWASGKTFNVGDTLEFQYGPLHSVNEVSESDYKACSSSNFLNSYSNMDTTITLNTLGGHYFICGTPGHCTGGMKLAVTVSGSSSGSPPSTEGTPSSPGNSPGGGSGSLATPSYPSTKPSPGTTPTPVSIQYGAAGFDGSGLLAGALLLVGSFLIVG